MLYALPPQPRHTVMYPDLLEQYWIQRACRTLGTSQPAHALQQMVPAIAKLSDMFTTERPGEFGRYGNDEQAQLAYGLFFFPQTFMRISFLFQELSAACVPPAGSPLRMLDLGAGLGAATCAAAAALSDRRVQIRAVDHAVGSLRILEDIFEKARPALWPQAALSTDATGFNQPPRADEGLDLILVSFALNEAMQDQPDEAVEEWASRLLRALRPGGVLLLCEPALRVTSERLERLRDRMAARHPVRILGPCPHHRPCPLLRQGRVWCHEVRRWEVPASLAFLNSALHREVNVVKFSFLALAREPAPPPNPTAARARLVAAFTEENGKFTTRGCAADGEVHAYEILARHLDKSQRAMIHGLERGARITWPELKPLGNGALRAAGLPTREP